MSSLRIYLISVVGFVQIIMFFFTVRMILAKFYNGENDTYYYFKERKDTIFGIFLFLMFTLLIIIFNPGQSQPIFLSDKETQLFFILGVLGLINHIGN